MDYSILFLVLFLVGFGLVILYSTSSYKASLLYNDTTYWVKKQALFAAMGICGMLFIATRDYHIWQKKWWFAWVIYGGVIGLLLLTFAIGAASHGSQRWISIGPFSLQPSELAKIGIILFLAGVYFLIGGLSWLPDNSQAMVWPLALIIAGVLFIFKPGRNKRAQWARQHTMEHRRQWMKMHQGRPGMNFESEQQQSESVDGFLRSENVWGAARHVVLDELFKGAMIRTSFGGTTIDLRHTHIAPGETYIDLDCSWGGVEIYVPSDWTVVFKCNAFFGGCDDKRWQNGNVNKENILVIRGTLSFGGLEVKD